jgi:K+ transporter
MMPGDFLNGGTTNLILAAVAVAILLMLIFGAAWLARRTSRSRLNTDYFAQRWQELQKKCGDSTTWPLAIIDADKLLDEALRKSHAKGKTMGERLVTVQRMLSNNDSVWYAHKLRNKLVHEQYDNLKERDVREALMGFRQALKDLGALK